MVRSLALLLLGGVACATPVADPAPRAMEAVSLGGDTLRRPPIDSAVAVRYDSLLQAARAAWEHAPDDLDSIIWLGRRTAYLGRYNEAIGIYTDGLGRHPDEPRLLRHRGHRHLTVRRLSDAIADLERAAQLVERTPDRIEQDGLPNALNIPTSTLQTNIWYHLGLARYVRGEFDQARAAYERGLALSPNPDTQTAMQYWLYLSLRRLGNDTAAQRVLDAVPPDLELIENTVYLRLIRLFQKRSSLASVLETDGVTSLDDVTTAYGIGAWHLLEGRPEVAHAIFGAILAARDQWPAFGYLAAEAELTRWRDPEITG